jgi:hypothetical protein
MIDLQADPGAAADAGQEKRQPHQPDLGLIKRIVRRQGEQDERRRGE